MAARKSSKSTWPKEIKLKDVVDLDLLAVAPDRSALFVPAHLAFLRFTQAEPQGVQVPIVDLPFSTPAIVTAFCALPDGNVVLVFPNDELLALVDQAGTVRGRVRDPHLRHVQSMLPSPAGDELVLVTDEAHAGLTTKARIVTISVDDLTAGREPKLLAERSRRPALGFDADGQLCWVDSRELVVRSGERLTMTPIDPRFGEIAIDLSNPVHFSISGDRCVARQSPQGGDYVVFDRGGRVIRMFSGLHAERLTLTAGGRTLVLTANRAKDRTGSADWVTWPDQRMLEPYVASFDTDSGALQGLVPRSAGLTHALRVIEGELVLVASYGRTRKIEILPWSAFEAAA